MFRIILKYLLYLLLFYYLIKWVERALFGDWKEAERIRKKNQKEQERAYRKYKRREGSVTIESMHTPPKKFKKEEGEYVDYEEVK